MSVSWVRLRTALPVLVSTVLPLAGAASSSADVGASVEAESLLLPASTGMPFADATASGQTGLLVWSVGAATGTIAAGSPSSGLVVRARGDQCEGAPVLQVSVDGAATGSVAIGSSTWSDVFFPGSWAAGQHRVVLSFPNDHTTSWCDRNLRLDRVQLTAAPAPAPVPGNPFAGARPYRDPASRAAAEAGARRSWDPGGAAALDKVAAAAGADWYGDWNTFGTLAGTVRTRVAAQRAAGALPVLVAYDIPHRDCGSYSSGGAAGADAYRQWVAALAAGIGSAPAVVVLEPDALAQMDCLSSADRSERTGLLSGAVRTLTALPATTVYLDAGGVGWQPASVMASRLAAAGVAGARGFSLNVSGFTATSGNLAYGDDVSRQLGGKHFVIDSSRNGQGAGDTWCNPAGRGLGTRMTSATGDPLADAVTWVKAPGESDGTCGGGPSAGQFWTDYAIGLGQRAAP